MNLKLGLRGIILILLVLLSLSANAELRERPENWAQPVIGSSLDNLYSVDKGVFRSEQPDEEEFSELFKFGVTDVLNLRYFHKDDDELGETKLNLHRVRMNASAVNEKEVVSALKIIRDRKGPILVHCWHGSDRTGVIIAAYRVVFNSWSKEQAIDEMMNGGYGYHNYLFPGLVTLIRNLDVAKIRGDLGLSGIAELIQ